MLKLHNPGKNTVLDIREYALRFLKYNRTAVPHLQAEAPKTPDRISDSGIMDVSWDDHLTEVCTVSLSQPFDSLYLLMFATLPCLSVGSQQSDSRCYQKRTYL